MKYTIDNYPIKEIQVGDEIAFTPDLVYEVATDHLLLRNRGTGRNNGTIFRMLGMNEASKRSFCAGVYGYHSDGLFNKFRTLIDGVAIVNALFQRLIDKNNIKPKVKVEVQETQSYTDYIIGRVKIRLFGNPLTIIKPTEQNDNSIPRGVSAQEPEWAF